MTTTTSAFNPRVDHLNVLLSGVVGSTAYGLAGPGSDVDRLAVFAAPTRQILGLRKVKESIVRHEPDITLHEIGKWCRLALAGNPTVVELVWLPEDLYDVRTDLGFELVEMRDSFLCAPRVRAAYLGYATQQFKRLETRGDGTFSSDLAKRTAKHARHLYRLLYQGLELYASGRLEVRLPVSQVEQCRKLGELAAAGDIDAVRATLAKFEYAFDKSFTVLPSRPDFPLIDRWLRYARQRLLFVEAPDVVDDDEDG